MTENTTPKSPVGDKGVEGKQAPETQVKQQSPAVPDAQTSTQKGEGDQKGHTGRKVAVGFLVILGAILLVIANLAIWARFALLNTSGWVAAVGPLSQNPQVSNTISQYAVGQLLEGYDVKGTLEETLPEKFQVLGGPLTNALEGMVEETVATVIQSDAFNTVWVGVNRAGHTAIMKVLKGEGDHLYMQSGQLVLDLGDVYNFAQDKLGIEDLDLVPQADEGKLVLFESQQVAVMQEAVSYINTFGLLMPLLSLLAYVGAVLVSLWRRNTLLWIGIASAIVMGISLIVYKIVGSYVMINVADPLLRDLGRAIWQVVTDGYLVQTIFFMILGILLAIGAWQSTPDSAMSKLNASRKTKSASNKVSEETSA